MEENNKQYPEGHFVGLWMAIGVAIFTALGILLVIVAENPGMVAIGPALGVSIGLSIGSAIEAKYKKEGKVRPLTEEERKRKKRRITIVIILLILLFVAGAVVVFLY